MAQDASEACVVCAKRIKLGTMGIKVAESHRAVSTLPLPKPVNISLKSLTYTTVYAATAGEKD